MVCIVLLTSELIFGSTDSSRLASGIMKPNYEYISSIDYINSLMFDYIETYSLQRGEEFEKEHKLGRQELTNLKEKQTKSALKTIEEKRFEELNDLYGQIQYLINSDGKFHPSSKKISNFKRLDSKVTILKDILRTEIKDIPMWMCAPVYRDAIVFYKDNKIVSTLNVCLSCEYMETKMFKHVNADNETYKLLRQFFIDCGHDIEEKNANGLQQQLPVK